MSQRSLLLGVLALSLSALAGSADDGFRVIAHPSVPGDSIDRKTLGAIYLKQVVHWSTGVAIEPIDQSASSPVRARFSEAVFGQPVAWVTSHWSRLMTSGKGWPPAVKASDADVIAQVRKNRGAIGYVSAAATLDETVKVLELLD
ncbi:MAG: hypothetical protein AB7O37_12640 [Vicinamibacteria bacterium]